MSKKRRARSRASARIHPVILSGGSGSRLWPLSRALYPKQFLRLASDRTLLQECAQRVAGRDYASPLVVCNAEHRFVVAEQLREIGVAPRAIVLEPEGRNTAPAATVATLMICEEDPDSVVMILPSDHVIEDEDAFHSAAKTAAQAARKSTLVTFGVRAERPETGFGYIEKGEALEEVEGCFAVSSFVEKPPLQSAKRLIASGRHYWNSGIYVFEASFFLAALEILEPEIVKSCRLAINHGVADLDFFRLDASSFVASPSDSIDRAVTERIDTRVVVPVDLGWIDVGSWSALWELGPKDVNGNVVAGDVFEKNVRNSYLRGEGVFVTALGVEDLVVVATDDAVLVANMVDAQEVKTLVDGLRSSGRTEHITHRTVYRPWGHFRRMDTGPGYQVKRITVKPGGKLSLQRHRQRAEHWVVVSGEAKVTRDGEAIILSENQSTYIPAGMRHRLENTGDQPLHLIEVQSGSYLGEDDIERFDDVYGRAADKKPKIANARQKRARARGASE